MWKLSTIQKEFVSLQFLLKKKNAFCKYNNTLFLYQFVI